MRKLFTRIFVLFLTSAFTSVAIIFVIVILNLNNWCQGTKILSGIGYTLLKTREIKNYSNIDALFLGSSTVYRGIDTRIFDQHNIKAFNLGTSGQSPYNSYYLLKDHISTVRPKCVVVDLYWPLAAKEGTEPTIDIVSNHELTYNMFEMAFRSHNMLTIRNVIAVALNRLYKPLNTVQVEKNSNDNYIKGGFVATTKIDYKKKSYLFANFASKITLPLKMQLESIDKIIALCKSNNTKLIFILVPVSRMFKNNIKNYNDYTNIISAIAQKNNISFIDYNEQDQLDLTDNDYSDINHLNFEGAAKFTKRLFNDYSRVCLKKRIGMALLDKK